MYLAVLTSLSRWGGCYYFDYDLFLLFEPTGSHSRSSTPRIKCVYKMSDRRPV